LGYDGTSGIRGVSSGLPKYCVVGLVVVSGRGGSGARNGTEKLRDGALMHREKNDVKYPSTTTTGVQESASHTPALRIGTNQSASCL
jgi:hypothetical protein